MSWIEAFEQTSEAHRLVVFAEIRTEQALTNHNPGVVERRALNSKLTELGLMRAKLDSKLNAIIVEQRRVVDPTPAQVEHIKALTREVEAQRNASLVVSMTLDLATKVLDLTTGLAA